MMATSNFEDVWVPRIGDLATAQLRRSSSFGLLTGPLVLGLAIASSISFGSGKAEGIVIGLVGIGSALAIFGAWIRSRMKLAAAVSSWFGVKIGWQEMPRMRAAQFDAWCQQRGLTTTKIQDLS